MYVVTPLCNHYCLCSGSAKSSDVAWAEMIPHGEVWVKACLRQVWRGMGKAHLLFYVSYNYALYVCP